MTAPRSPELVPRPVQQVVGGNIRARRESLGFTQAEIGDQLGEILGTPWSRQQVFAAEKGLRAFTAAELAAFGFVLTTHPGRLLEPPADVLVVELSPGHPIAAGWMRSHAPDALPQSEQAIRDVNEQVRQMHNLSRTFAEQIWTARDRLGEALNALGQPTAAHDDDAS